ncbi:MAG TPA: outer membrane lipoprotein carrier protein LolA [Anaeromyxobacteraceae bacterium]|nr:outer membrane lipoprotein carrier protein LolA [Anaeromyxobacteraceae bacterium]
MLAPLAAILLAAAAAAPAPAPDAGALAAKVQAYYEGTRDLTAKFQQTYRYAGFGRKLASAGTLRVKKPGMMRWDYETPEPKTVAVKGTRLVQYEPEVKQAYVDERFDATAMSAAVTFLLGQGDLAKEFHLRVNGEGNLVLRPKQPDPRVEEVILTVGKGGEVVATRVEDGSGNVNEVRFTDVKRNAGIPDAAFDVKLPSGVKRLKAPGAGAE